MPLNEKLERGVTWEELTADERWRVISRQSSDYLYHTHYIDKTYQGGVTYYHQGTTPAPARKL